MFMVHKDTYVVIMEDFKVQLRKQKDVTEEYLGEFRFDERNEKGSMMVELMT